MEFFFPFLESPQKKIALRISSYCNVPLSTRKYTRHLAQKQARKCRTLTKRVYHASVGHKNHETDGIREWWKMSFLPPTTTFEGRLQRESISLSMRKQGSNWIPAFAGMTKSAFSTTPLIGGPSFLIFG